MSSKTFLTIPKSECLTTYRSIIDNSDRKWESALHVASIGDYGGATSLAIISVEELVKALIVFLDGNGFNLRSIKGIDTLFKNHQIRYVIAFAMAVMNIFADELMKFLKKFQQEPDKMMRLGEDAQNDKNYFEKHFKLYAFRKLITVKREFRWFSKADFYRQDGFYCDYQDRLKSPILISKAECVEVLERLRKVRLVGKGIIDAFEIEDKVCVEQIELMKRKFIDNDYYSEIEAALANVKQTRQNPFELILQFFKRKTLQD